MKIPVIAQSAIPLTRANVFTAFPMFYMQQALKLDSLWTALCIMGAVYFVFPS